MSLKPVPRDWCDAVYAVLRTSDPQVIRYTGDAWARFEATCPDAFRPELQGAFMSVMRSGNPLMGCPVQLDSPAGTTWEFYFRFRTLHLYGKILLRPDQRAILIFSAHRPLKSKLSCE